MIIRTTSHRSSEKLDRALGKHPQYYYTLEGGGCFVILESPAEIEKALAIKGVTRCRNQNEDDYGKCWDMGLAK